MLTSRMTQTLDIPGEPGQSVTIRKLSHYQLMMAQDAKIDSLIERMKGFEGIKLPDPDPTAQPQVEDPVQKYDRMTVLKHGVTDWSYDEAPTQDGRATGVAELDEETAAWLFNEIIGFSVRSAEEGEASASVSPSSTSARDAGL